VATWEVLGGREEYQLSLEHTETGDFVWHCTCPDAVYHAEYRHACGCKHVAGLRRVYESFASVDRQPVWVAKAVA
jgi:predicted nucleic acid-binding Zn finger protein